MKVREATNKVVIEKKKMDFDTIDNGSESYTEGYSNGFHDKLNKRSYGSSTEETKINEAYTRGYKDGFEDADSEINLSGTDVKIK